LFKDRNAKVRISAMKFSRRPQSRVAGPHDCNINVEIASEWWARQYWLIQR
jgi:hypothetical protein